MRLIKLCRNIYSKWFNECTVDKAIDEAWNQAIQLIILGNILIIYEIAVLSILLKII